jgi:hypothetical protein
MEEEGVADDDRLNRCEGGGEDVAVVGVWKGEGAAEASEGTRCCTYGPVLVQFGRFFPFVSSARSVIRS